MTPQTKNKKRCGCELRRSYGRSCRNCSKYKLVFLLKKNQDHLKENGFNPVRWCFLRENAKPHTNVQNSMVRRLKQTDPKLFEASNKVQFRKRGDAEPLNTL